MKNAIIYIHGKGGNANEIEHYKLLFADCDALGFDYSATTPWEAKNEFTMYFDQAGKNYESVILIAVSIGAFFTMNAKTNQKISKAYFISPVVDMKKLIYDMMSYIGVTEEELQRLKNIETDFGETLSWEYLCYAKKNPIEWKIPTHILYGEKDHLTSFETISSFSKNIGATLDVMKDSKHWFHTKKQMSYLDGWINKYQNTKYNDAF